MIYCAKPHDKRELKMPARGFSLNAIVGAAMTLAFAVTAQAQNNRSFVATTGDDINNCSVSAYCRTFTRALAVTNPGGEIVVVNSGGYGPATITKAVTISATGIDASITQTTSGDNALTINTTGDVTITGLNLFGGGTGNDGVLVQAVGLLHLYNMQIQGFLESGIEFAPPAGNLILYDSKINDNHRYGLLHTGHQAYVRNTEFDNNTLAAVSSPGLGGGMTIVNSSAHNNQVAFYTDSGNLALYNDRVIFNGVALFARNGTVYFADCLISDNGFSFDADTGGTMAGSSPGTSLVTPGQSTIGLSAPIAIPSE